MDSRNLALMFGPTLIKDNNDNMATIVQDMSDQCRIVESIILHHDWFFGSWDRDSFVPLDEGQEQEAPPTNTTISRMVCSDEGKHKLLTLSPLQACLVQSNTMSERVH